MDLKVTCPACQTTLQVAPHVAQCSRLTCPICLSGFANPDAPQTPPVRAAAVSTASTAAPDRDVSRDLGVIGMLLTAFGLLACVASFFVMFEHPELMRNQERVSLFGGIIVFLTAVGAGLWGASLGKERTGKVLLGVGAAMLMTMVSLALGFLLMASYMAYMLITCGQGCNG